MRIRVEKVNDFAAVYAVNVSAFETPAEAKLIYSLREHAEPIISLVAEENENVVGHIMFSPVSLTGYPNVKMMGLGPMAVSPQHQRKGIGSELVRTGLEHCQQHGFAAVVVLGHPDYYPRFGFLSASGFGIDSEYEVSDEVFMAIELQEKVLRGKAGRVKYHPAFGNL